MGFCRMLWLKFKKAVHGVENTVLQLTRWKPQSRKKTISQFFHQFSLCVLNAILCPLYFPIYQNTESVFPPYNQDRLMLRRYRLEEFATRCLLVPPRRLVHALVRLICMPYSAHPRDPSARPLSSSPVLSATACRPDRKIYSRPLRGRRSPSPHPPSTTCSRPRRGPSAGARS